MASQALAEYNQRVDEYVGFSDAERTALKNAGERLFIAGGKETIRHLRKHMVAVRDDSSETNQRRTLAQRMIGLIDDMVSTARYGDAWWLDISEQV